MRKASFAVLSHSSSEIYHTNCLDTTGIILAELTILSYYNTLERHVGTTELFVQTADVLNSPLCK